MKTAVLFDLDDTLYSERDYQQSGWKAVAREAEKRGKLGAEAAYSLMSGAMDAFDALHDACPGFPVSEMVDIYRTHRPDISTAPGVKSLLQFLRDAGVATGIITDGRSIGQRNKIEALGLDKQVDYISISEEIGADKLSDRPFVRAMEHFGPDFQYIYVGDNPAKDFLQPNALGWHTIMVREAKPGVNIHPQNLHVTTPLALPDIVADNIEDVKHVFSKICPEG